MPSEKVATESQPFLDNYSDDFPPTEAQRSQYRPESRRKAWKSYAVVFVITSLLWMLLILITTPYSWTPRSSVTDARNITSNAKLLTCGDCVDEAQQLGCKYDILLNNWVPEPCYDQEFIDEYTDDDSWAAYADEDLTQRITSVEEMSEREFYYTSVRDHVNHCAMMWRKQFWVMFEQRRGIDTMLADPAHTEHCAMYLGGMLHQTMNSTKVDVGYAGCWVRQ